MISLIRVSLASLLLVTPALAQKFEPHVGQAGKDVIWVPTPDEVVDRMLTMAQVGPNDIHFDLGAGDGKIAIAAAKKFGARATGVEYNPDMVKHANGKAQEAGVATLAGTLSHGLGPGSGRAAARRPRRAAREGRASPRSG